MGMTCRRHRRNDRADPPRAVAGIARSDLWSEDLDVGGEWAPSQSAAPAEMQLQAGRARRVGVPESVVMRMSGHRTRTVFERYNVVDTQDFRAAVRALESLGHV